MTCSEALPLALVKKPIATPNTVPSTRRTMYSRRSPTSLDECAALHGLPSCGDLWR